MLRLAFYAIFGALIGSIAIFLLADGVAEGAIAGVVLGASIGIIVAVRKGAGGASPSFEYEAAGIHDGNLTTIARRNLVREEYRDSFDLKGDVRPMTKQSGDDLRVDDNSSATSKGQVR